MMDPTYSYNYTLFSHGTLNLCLNSNLAFCIFIVHGYAHYQLWVANYEFLNMAKQVKIIALIFIVYK